MTPKEAAAHLNQFYSEKSIATAVGTTQPTVHKIIHSPNHQPFWPLGDALIRLAKKTRRKASDYRPTGTKK